MNPSLLVLEVDGASRSQTAPPPAHLETEVSTQIYSAWAPVEVSSSTLKRTQSSVEANPSAVGESATTNSQNLPHANSSRDRLLRKKARVQELLDQLRPGRSADGFFAFYEQPAGAMASTRSTLREGLRQAPKVNQPFIPDTAPVRQTRSATQPASNQETSSSHTPSFQAVGVEGSTSNIAEDEAFHIMHVDSVDGEETKPVLVSTRDVLTPGNRPEQFRRRGKEVKQIDFYNQYYPLQHLEVNRGFHIYRHVLMSLQCPDPEQVDFALFHLVQMSNTRGDKFRFEGFPMLMETLMEIAMGVTELLTGVWWEYERDPYQWPLKKDRPNVLNTLWGTDDILTRIKKLRITLSDDSLEDEYFSSRLRRIKEATLVLRNMCLLPENAYHIATQAKGLLRDFLCVMMNVPKQPRFNELRNDALDIAEEVTKYMPTASYDPVCVSLYRCIGSKDRAHITRALWAITHFSSELVETKNLAMVNVPHHHVANLATYLLMEADPDMLNGVMDYFYQYTLDRVNAQYLPRVVNMTVNLIPRLVNLLSYEAVEVVEEVEVLPEKIAPAPTAIPKVPPELSRQLMALAEPERSSQWLRCCFVEDSDCEITQIALWQAYQIRFGSTPNALAAAEFIKNVSATFTNAQAQVVPAAGPNGQTSTRFIIKGIRPLETALAFDGWPYLYCEWAVGDQPGHLCDRAFTDPQELRKHVFVEHTGLEPLEHPNQYNWEKAMQSPKACRWDGCTRYKTPSTEAAKVINHVSSHLSQQRKPDAQPPILERKILQQRQVRRRTFRNTPVNADGEPVGVAYKAALILRNLLEHLPDTVFVKDGNHAEISTVDKKELFLARRSTIIAKYCENRNLRVPLTDVLSLIGKLGDRHD
ncbi:Chromatin structure-remodeling complex protein rsc9 [Talaromyces marneffei ATCC 18224]|uniref:Chromatin remodeling complex subunit (Rsc9), putative n=1 Tax=Talaromyces marneffei (strain ATCC 18224 / CBS 334.59 / QM 7333) TaxID=441960 RepID=B6Q4E7_TALMQ|nr:chromatin remodeling complex subunit (Rsc9), putative [Talaromyces marneffei ATCC 18224]KAE8556106.1 hypothetical protein EYB25_000806 [Talaromyces marneffei]